MCITGRHGVKRKLNLDINRKKADILVERGEKERERERERQTDRERETEREKGGGERVKWSVLVDEN